jgi:hypothetical protein
VPRVVLRGGNGARRRGSSSESHRHVGAIGDADHREVAHAAEEAVGGEGPVEACEQLVGARAVVGIDEADFGDAVIESENRAHRSQADHTPSVGVGAVAAAGLSGGGELEAGIHQRLQNAVGVDKSVGGFGPLGSGAGEDGRGAAAEVVEGETLAHCLGVGGSGGFGNRVVHGCVSVIAGRNCPVTWRSTSQRERRGIARAYARCRARPAGTAFDPSQGKSQYP